MLKSETFVVIVHGLYYLYSSTNMISGMSRADVKNVLLIMHIDSVILGVVPHT